MIVGIMIVLKFFRESESLFFNVDITIQALLAGLPPSNTHTHDYSSGMDARARAGMQKMTYIFDPDSFPSVVFIHSFTIPSFTQPTLARGWPNDPLFVGWPPSSSVCCEW
jgi:hypothetical protein